MTSLQSKHLNLIKVGTFLQLDFTGSKENNRRNRNEIPVCGNEEDTVLKGTVQLGRFG